MFPLEKKKTHNIDTVFTEIKPKYLNVAPKEKKQAIEEKSSKKNHCK